MNALEFFSDKRHQIYLREEKQEFLTKNGPANVA